MSWQIIRAASGSPDRAVIGVVTDTAGLWSFHLAGQTQALTIADATDYKGIGYVSFSGIPEGTYLASATNSGEIKTVPVVITNGAHKTVFSSCMTTYSGWEVVAGAMLTERPALNINLGDAPYTDSLRQVTAAADKPKAIRQEHTKWLRHPSRSDLFASVERVTTRSDHGSYPGNDVPGRIDIGDFPGDDAWNFRYYESSGLYPKAVNSQAEALALKDTGDGIFEDFNPLVPNPDAGQVYAGAPIPAYTRYSRFTRGRIEYFVLDMVTQCDYITQSGVSDRSMLGAQQLAWFLDRVKKSTATFKVIVAEQQILKETPIAITGRNDYGRRCFSDEGLAIRAALTNFTGWAVPGGALVLSGDVHTPSVMRDDAHSNKLWQITPCPGGTGGVPQLVNTASDVALLFAESYSDSAVPRRYYGVLEDTGAGNLRVAIKNHTGGTSWAGELVHGTNDVIYPQPLLAIG